MPEARTGPDWPSLWKPFTVRDRTVLGVAAAFALVATANANVSARESRRFADLVRGAQLGRDAAELQALSAAFSALTEAMLSSPIEGRAQALETLGTFAGDPFRAEIILSAAQAAMLADADVSGAERSALEAVCQGIGVNPRHLVRR
jgi:tellurite resistance protein